MTAVGSSVGDAANRPRKKIRPPRAAPSATAPGRSKEKRSGRTCARGSTRSAAATTIAPIGMLMKKTYSHPNASTSPPPTTGDASAPMATTEPRYPRARPRSETGKASKIRAFAIEKTMAPPTAWTIRAPIRTARVGAKPHAADASVKSVMPATKSGARPVNSEILPIGRRSTVIVSR